MVRQVVPHVAGGGCAHLPPMHCGHVLGQSVLSAQSVPHRSPWGFWHVYGLLIVPDCAHAQAPVLDTTPHSLLRVQRVVPFAEQVAGPHWPPSQLGQPLCPPMLQSLSS